MQLYFPGDRLPPPAQFAAAGMADLLDEQNAPSAIAAPRGPDGASGTIYFWDGSGAPGGRVDWSPCKARKDLAAGRCWFGRPARGQRSEVRCRKSDPCPVSPDPSSPASDPCPLTPSALARKRQLASSEVLLADGQAWLVPLALRLPKRWTIDDAGEGVQQVQSSYQAFYARCENAFNIFRQIAARGADPARRSDITIPGGFSLCVEALALNYRVNADVIDWLELLDDAAAIRVLGATFEWDKLREIEAQKKTAG